jgi:hypothetical protein
MQSVVSNKYVSNTSLFMQNSFDGELDAHRVVQFPSTLRSKFDYVARTDGLPTYAGYVARGTATDAGVWLLFRYTYDSNNQCTDIEVAYDTWDNRTSAAFS